MEQRRRLIDHALELLAGRVRDAEVLIDALGKLRRTLDRHDWIGPGWFAGSSVGILTSTLKLMLVSEFETASSVARKLGGRKVVRLAGGLDAARTPFLSVIDPPDDAGVPQAERDALRKLLDDLRDAGTAAASRRRRIQFVVVTTFVVGAAIGFIGGLLVGAAR